jgi:glucosamine-6-phosphate deaminase
MAAPVTMFDNPEQLGWTLAGEILERTQAALRRRRRFLLGCPGGRSLRTTYRALARQASEANDDLSHAFIVMMDEYLQPIGRGGFARCPPDAHYSCLGFAFREIVGPINAALPADRCIPDNHVWIPDPNDPEIFDRYLEEAGGVDLFLLATGTSDGHVAFNPPGAGLDEETHIVALAESTRRDNLATFPGFKSITDVPTHGISVGLGTIAGLSQEVVLVAHGAQKRDAVRRLRSVDSFDPSWPATIVHACRDARIYIDQAAAN